LACKDAQQKPPADRPKRRSLRSQHVGRRLRLTFLSAGAETFRVLTGGRELVGPYRFCSLTIKGPERRLDGIFEPDGHDGPVYVVEFQGQHSEKAFGFSSDFAD
jgi:hypothetical protein